jgi:hypothetical protein
LTSLLLLPLDRAGRIFRLWVNLRNGARRIDSALYCDRCRVAGLSQINPDVIARLTRRRAESTLARQFDNSLARHAATVGPPDRNGERENKIVVLAGARVERQVTGRGEVDTEIL